MTSKYNSHFCSINTYGYKGQALSSLVEVCKTLRIETRTKGDNVTAIKVKCTT